MLLTCSCPPITCTPSVALILVTLIKMVIFVFFVYINDGYFFLVNFLSVSFFYYLGHLLRWVVFVCFGLVTK